MYILYRILDNTPLTFTIAYGLGLFLGINIDQDAILLSALTIPLCSLITYLYFLRAGHYSRQTWVWPAGGGMSLGILLSHPLQKILSRLFT